MKILKKDNEDPNSKLPDIVYFYRRVTMTGPANLVSPDNLDSELELNLNLDKETGQFIENLIDTETKAGFCPPALLEDTQKRVWQKLTTNFDIKEYTEHSQQNPGFSFPDQETKFSSWGVKPSKVSRLPILSRFRSWSLPRVIMGSMVCVTLLGLLTLALLTFTSASNGSGSTTSLRTPVESSFVPISTATPANNATSRITASPSVVSISPQTSAAPTRTALAASSPEITPQPQSTTRGDVVTPRATATPPSTPRRDIYASIVLTGHTGPVTQVEWSPDGKFLASSSTTDPVVRVWTVGATSLQATTLFGALPGHQDGVVSLEWSPDGKMLASGSKDGTIKIWDFSTSANTITYTLIKTLNSPGLGPVQSLSYAPGGKTLAVAYKGSANIQVVMWRTVDWTLQKQLDSGTNFFQAYNLKWSPDGEFLAGGLTLYKLWKVDGTEIGTAYNGGTPAWGLAWSPDSKRWAVATESSIIYVYDTAAKQSSYFNAGNGDWLAWSPDGKLLASGQYVITLTKTDNPVISEEDILVRASGLAAGVASLAWSPDGQRLATGENRNPTYNYSPDDNAVVLWNRQGQILTVLTGHNGPVDQVSWSPNGKLLASGSEDKNIRIWQINN